MAPRARYSRPPGPRRSAPTWIEIPSSRRSSTTRRIVDTLSRYASSIDGKDFVALRAVFADDATARYGDREWMTGADEIVGWIAGYAEQQAWQHHHVSVYHVELDATARARARTLTYHTCHQAPLADPQHGDGHDRAVPRRAPAGRRRRGGSPDAR